MTPALLLFILMMAMPESPRWLLFRAHIESKNDLLRRRYYYERAFRSLDFLRPTRLQAARDLLQHHAYIEKQMARLRNDDAEVEESTNSSTPSETDQVEAHNKAPGAATDRQDENLARPTPSVPSQSANERHHVSDRTELFSFASHTWGPSFRQFISKGLDTLHKPSVPSCPQRKPNCHVVAAALRHQRIGLLLHAYVSKSREPVCAFEPSHASAIRTQFFCGKC